MNCIEIENLTFTYPGADKSSLRNISFTVAQGDFLAIMGSNGSGKSTLCKNLNGLIPHFTSGDIEGSVMVGGLDVAEHEVGELALKVGYVYQDFENQIVRPTVLDEASFACLNYAFEDFEEKGREALQLVGLHNKDHDFIWQLSGGQKHLLALAGSLALRPDILILDEPVAQLDPSHARQVYDTLRYLNEVHGKTIIVIEHHTEFIAEYCKNALLMDNGELKWKLPAKVALRRVEELEASHIFPPQVTLAARDLKTLGHLAADASLPTTIEEGVQAFSHLELRAAQPKHRSKLENALAAIEYQGVGFNYRAVKGDHHTILDDFNLQINKGEKIALIGSNGAGKSTLMKLLTGILKPSEGEVRLHGTTTKAITMEELSKTISIVFQNPEEMFIMDSIRGDIEYAMCIRELPNYKEKAEELMELFNLTALAERDGRMLSGGQMRRASLAIGIALQPSILLLDEPTANLDIATRKNIMKTLELMKEVTETVIIATHDMQLVCEWAERIIVLSQGKIVADGSWEEVFSNEHAIRVSGIRPPEIFELAKQLDVKAASYSVADFVASVQGRKTA